MNNKPFEEMNWLTSIACLKVSSTSFYGTKRSIIKLNHFNMKAGIRRKVKTI